MKNLKTIIAKILSIFIKKQTDKDFIIYKRLGQIALDKKNIFEIDTFSGTDFVLHCGNNILINAGNKELDLRVGNSSKIKITKDRIDITGDLFINNEKVKINK